MSTYDSLMNYISSHLSNSEVFKIIYAAYGNEFDTIKSNRTDLLNQFFVSTATWGLAYWEAQFGIKTDTNKSDAYRRSRILSKIRGTGTVSKAMLKNVAESFSNGAVDIIEYNNEYRFVIRFSGTIGIPPNMDDLTEAIEEIKPAHLAYSYDYVYEVYNSLAAKTHSQLAVYTHDQIRNGGIH